MVRREHNMHPTYLSNRFKAIFGISPIKLKNAIRIEKAKSLLKKRDVSVSDVALSLGYDDPNYFTHFFKNQVGMSRQTTSTCRTGDMARKLCMTAPHTVAVIEYQERELEDREVLIRTV